MEIPLTVVLTLVVILIVAVIVLVIFQGGLGPAVEFGTAQSACRQSAAAVCASSNSMTATWNVATNKVKGSDGIEVYQSCKQIVGDCSCAAKQLSGC